MHISPRTGHGGFTSLALFSMAVHTFPLLLHAHFQTPPRITVSGQSAGGSMSIQHLVAFSSEVDGALVAAGSPYGCGAMRQPFQTCYYGHMNETNATEYIESRFHNGLIDDPQNLRQTPVVLFSGTNDWLVYTRVMRETYWQLQKFMAPFKILRSFNTKAAHVWSVDHGKCKCGACWRGRGSLECCDVNNCDLDLSGLMFRHFYGRLKIAARVTARNEMHWINQWNYIPKQGDWMKSGLLKWALAYVPTSCVDNLTGCRAHVNYHGCTYNIWQRRLLWATSLDLNEYGEANGIVILYPQSAGDRSAGVGCWNWGQDSRGDRFFDTRRSVQLLTVRHILSDLKNALSRAIRLPFNVTMPGEPAHPRPFTREHPQ